MSHNTSNICRREMRARQEARGFLFCRKMGPRLATPQISIKFPIFINICRREMRARQGARGFLFCRKMGPSLATPRRSVQRSTRLRVSRRIVPFYRQNKAPVFRQGHSYLLIQL